MSVTIRGMQDLADIQEMLQQYSDEMETVGALRQANFDNVGVLEVKIGPTTYTLTGPELVEVYHRRADLLSAKLRDRGIYIGEDKDTLASITREQQKLADTINLRDNPLPSIQETV